MADLVLNYKYYIYTYLDPRKPGDYNYGDLHFDYEPFYIGKGKGNRYKAKHSCNSFLNGKINHIGKDNIIVMVEMMPSEAAAHFHEMIRIAIIGRIDLGLGPLVNMTDGGEGSSGARPDYITREKMSKARLGKKMSQEFKDKMRLINLGKKATIQAKLNMSISHIGKKNTRPGYIFSEETKKKMSIAKIGNKNAAGKRKNPVLNIPQNVKEKISKTLTGRKRPADVIEKMKIAQRARRNRERLNNGG